MDIQRRYPRRPVYRWILCGGLGALAQMMVTASAAESISIQPQAISELPEAVEQGEVSDDKLRQFALAVDRVKEVQDEHAVKAELLQHETETKMVEVVEGSGLSVEEFRVLVERMQTDPHLAERFRKLQGD